MQDLKKKTDIRNLIKEMETIMKKENTMKILELKIIIFKMKFYWMGLTANWTIPKKKKKNSVCLRTGQQKISKLKNRKKKD